MEKFFNVSFKMVEKSSMWKFNINFGGGFVFFFVVVILL